MNITMPFPGRRRRIIAVTAMTLLLTCSVATTQVEAFASVVFNPASLLQSAQQFSERLTQWQKTLEQYQKTANHYIEQAKFWQTQLNKLRHLRFSLFATKHKFTKIPEDFGVDVECPGRDRSRGFAGILDMGLDKLIPSENGNVLAQQQELCVQIVQAKNEKYNDTVEYLDFVKLKTDELLKVQNSLVSKIGSSLGNTQGLTQQLTEFSETLDTARATWETNQKQSDDYIKMLLTMQATLSRRALNGAPSVLGSVINTVALKAALKK